MTHRAQVNIRTAYLSTEFGEKMARRIFGDEVVDSLPRFVKGKRKGCLKGDIIWAKVERGGWVRTGSPYEPGECSQGYVERRKGSVIEVALRQLPWGEKQIITHRWFKNEEDRIYRSGHIHDYYGDFAEDCPITFGDSDGVSYE